VRIAACPLPDRGMEKVTETSAPEIGAPVASVSFTRRYYRLFGEDRVRWASSAFACGAFIVLPAPAPGRRGTNVPSAAWSWLSESIRKLADVTIFSPVSLFQTMNLLPLASELHFARSM